MSFQPIQKLGQVICSLGALISLNACSPSSDEMVAPPPAPTATVESVSVTANTQPEVAAPDTIQTQATFVQPNVLSTTDPTAYSAKDIAKIIEHLDWFAENYISQKNRIPTLDELKAWKDPNFPLGLPEWPKAPAGKRWAMNEKTGQFSLADDIAAK